MHIIIRNCDNMRMRVKGVNFIICIREFAYTPGSIDANIVQVCDVRAKRVSIYIIYTFANIIRHCGTEPTVRSSAQRKK